MFVFFSVLSVKKVKYFYGYTNNLNNKYKITKKVKIEPDTINDFINLKPQYFSKTLN